MNFNLKYDSYRVLKNHITSECYNSLIYNFSSEELAKCKTFEEFITNLKLDYKISDIPYLYGIYKQGNIYPNLKYFTILDNNNSIHLFFINKEKANSIGWEDLFDLINFSVEEINNIQNNNYLLLFRDYLNNKFIQDILKENSSSENKLLLMKKIIKDFIEKKEIDNDLKEAYFILSFGVLLNDLFLLNEMPFSINIHTLNFKKEISLEESDLLYENMCLQLIDLINKWPKYELIGRDLLNNLKACRIEGENKKEFIKNNQNLQDVYKFINNNKEIMVNYSINNYFYFLNKIKVSFDELLLKANKELKLNDYINLNKKNYILHVEREYKSFKEFFTPTLQNIKKINCI